VGCRQRLADDVEAGVADGPELLHQPMQGAPPTLLVATKPKIRQVRI